MRSKINQIIYYTIRGATDNATSNIYNATSNIYNANETECYLVAYWNTREITYNNTYYATDNAVYNALKRDINHDN